MKKKERRRKRQSNESDVKLIYIRFYISRCHIQLERKNYYRMNIGWEKKQRRMLITFSKRKNISRLDNCFLNNERVRIQIEQNWARRGFSNKFFNFFFHWRIISTDLRWKLLIFKFLNEVDLEVLTKNYKKSSKTHLDVAWKFTTSWLKTWKSKKVQWKILKIQEFFFSKPS